MLSVLSVTVCLESRVSTIREGRNVFVNINHIALVNAKRCDTLGVICNA